MTQESKKKYIGVILIIVTIVVLLEMDDIFFYMNIALVGKIISNIFSGKERDNKFFISSIIGIITVLILDHLRLDSNFFNSFIQDNENGFYILKVVTYLSFWWVTALVYLLLLKNEPNYREFDKIQILLSKINIETISNINGKVEKIYITLDQEDERYFYDISPEFLISSTELIDNMIKNTKNTNFYGYEYAIRIFRIGNKEMFNWYINN